MKYEYLRKLHDLVCNARVYIEDNTEEICKELAEYDGDPDPDSYEYDVDYWKSELEELENGLFEVIEHDD